MASRTLKRRVAYRSINGHTRSRPRAIFRVLLVMLIAVMMLTSGASAATIFFYGENLPSLAQFKNHFQFQNTVFLDYSGKQVLYDMADLSKKSGARRVVEPLRLPGHTTKYYQSQHEDWLVGDDPCVSQPCDERGFQRKGIPIALQQATIATEDATFNSNPGFDPLSIARAAMQDLTTGHIVSGASTITQQLVKQYITGQEQTLSRKAEEIVLAAELTQKYPKSKILWYYLNGVSYGNLAVGVQAAAQTYFHTDVWNLDAAQCAMLAGLPEAPTLYDPVNNRQAAINRMHWVLHLMQIHGYLGNNSTTGQALADRYMKEANSWPAFSPPKIVKRYPQFIEYAINQLQHHIPALSGKIYKGLVVQTSLDTHLEDVAQTTVKQQVDDLGAAYNVTDGALVSMDLRPECYGCIRAYVGSADYNDRAIGGQIDMANSPRQPGSSFKPYNYIYAFQNGLAPGTTVLDAPIAIPDSGYAADGGWYEPQNYDHTYHGVVTLRVALQNSLNVPAVKVEQYGASVGPNGLWNIRDQAIKLGLNSFKADNPDCCGWALTLGGMQRGVRLVEHTSAYGVFATGGYMAPPTAIVKVWDRTTGKLLWSLSQDEPYAKRQQVLKPEYAYLMNNVLSDNASRCTPQVCEFGLDSPLYLGRPAAAKTGTTEEFTDNWTVGYTPDLVTGVWVGNADDSHMVNTTGVMGAAPIWNHYMLNALAYYNLPPKDFAQPSDVYSGSLCRLPGAYGSPSTGVFDIWAGVEPYCSVGSYNSSLPVPQQQTPYQAPAVTQPLAPPAAAVPPPTAAPVLQQPAPTVPPVQQPAAPPAVQPPAAQPPAQAPAQQPVQQAPSAPSAPPVGQPPTGAPPG